MNDIGRAIVERTIEFRAQVESLRFSTDSIVYNPLIYAWPLHEQYILKYVNKQVETLFLGMNPGPFGMAQTGVPFGEIEAVKHFLQLDGKVGRPPFEHPARPVLGMDIPRSEISGKRLWSLFEEHYGGAESCFSSLTVVNYCPLVFMDRGPTGRNITPDKLPKIERMALETICDRYLVDVVALLKPRNLIGVGKYAQKKLEKLFAKEDGFLIDSILHPSPGNPQANKGWNEKVTDKLVALGVWQ
ncbi:uracil-DNA glycosylase family protein [Sphaerochaeta sp. PS]|uniref:uracil-DNA glycosylase family protein n=1 Tax=Sphaerochaeta sp. PS TaxID=3076336 RepID=UPI0028A4C78F|nr:uracil-DNA glycosylase family protein [Sphaerochaeta sp. PS]MDT4762400.1 single-stranded DNA-binding protein [Sphaerochaeta sp. PS]